MKILVCISCVPDTTSKINFKDNDKFFDEQGVQFVINPNDEFGLTRAIWFKEKIGAPIFSLNQIARVKPNSSFGFMTN